MHRYAEFLAYFFSFVLFLCFQATGCPSGLLPSSFVSMVTCLMNLRADAAAAAALAHCLMFTIGMLLYIVPITCLR
jgi:hypothetical protein